MKILFVGTLYSGSNARSFFDAFSGKHDVRGIDCAAWTSPPRASPNGVSLRFRGRVASAANTALRKALSEACDGWQPDLLFCFKTVALDQSVLLRVPATTKVHYSPDDLSNPHNVSREYLELEGEWDAVVTTKSHNVQELTRRGAKRAIFALSAFDPRIHFGPPASPDRRYALGFIGAWRPDRSGLPQWFSRAAAHRSLICGPRWRRHNPMGVPGVDLRPPVYGRRYASVMGEIFASPILLNSDNRDAHTCRSLEVPACGVLAIAPRTEEHQALLDEHTECLMYASRAELEELLQRVQREPARMSAVAEAGQKRILGGRHTYADRCDEILSALAS